MIPLSFLFQSKLNAQYARKGVVPTSGAKRKATVIQPEYTMEALIGKWQEIKRRTLSAKERIEFSDTLQLNFNKRDSVIIRDGITMSQRGYARIEGLNNLQLAGDEYSILYLSKNILVLNDGEYSREFQKKNLFYHETLGKIIVPKDDLSVPVTVDMNKIMGKWVVYRTQAVPGAADDSAIIKYITFSSENKGILSGEVTYSKANKTESHPFTANPGKGSLMILTNGHTWDLKTYKANGKELVFGKQGGLIYFAKQF